MEKWELEGLGLGRWWHQESHYSWLGFGFCGVVGLYKIVGF